MTELIFDNGYFPEVNAIREYLATKEAEAEEAKTIWQETLVDPIKQFTECVNLAFGEDRIRGVNPYPERRTKEAVVRKIRVSADLTADDIKDSTDRIDVTEVKTPGGQLVEAEIRMKYPEIPGRKPPPWEQEVYTLMMDPTRISSVYSTNDRIQVTPLYDGGLVEISEPPVLLVQTSEHFRRWEKETRIVPSQVGPINQAYNEPELARRVFAHGVARLQELLSSNVLHICESYELTPPPVGSVAIPIGPPKINL